MTVITANALRPSISGRYRLFIDKLFLYKDKSFALIRDFKSSKQVFKGKEVTDNLQHLMYSLAVKHMYPEFKTRESEFLFLKFDLTKDRKRFSMDWYYPILSGCLKQDEKSYYINKIFKDFYLDGIGIKCVIEEPWVTVAETSEFILALMCAGYDDEAKRLLFDVLNISDEEGIPFMGWQYEQNIFWPEEKPSWTAAALMLSADCVFDYSDASDLFKSDQRSVFYETS